MDIIKTNWNWNGKMQCRSSTKYIALHHAEASYCTAEQIDGWHKANGWSGIGYHFFVRKDGKIYEGRPIWAVGAHVQGMNDCSIGICAEGAYTREFMPDTQKKAICELLVYLKGIYPSAKIVGHREIGDSDCPGKNYPLEDIKNNYAEYAEGEEEMTASEKEKMNAIDESLTRLYTAVEKLITRVDKMESPMIYNYIDDNMPEWAHDGVQWCLDNGIITGTGEGLGLDDKDLKLCTMLMRIGKK